MASVVLPAPFWPTMASDDAGRDREVEAVEHRRAARVGEGHVAEADLARRHAARPARSPAGQRAGRGHRRLEAQHGGDRRRRAVERPVEPAERDQRRADRALGVDDERAEVEAAVRPPRDRATRTRRRWRPTTSSRLQTQRPLAQPGRLVLQLVQPRAPRRRSARSSSPRGRTAAAPCPPADRRPAGRRSRRRAARSRTSSVLRSRQTALSRSSQCVASQAAAEHERRPPGVSRTSTAADASPPIISTRPPAMKSIEMRQRRPGHAEVEVARHREVAGQRRVLEVRPCPGGRTQASVSRS